VLARLPNQWGGPSKPSCLDASEAYVNFRGRRVFVGDGAGGWLDRAACYNHPGPVVPAVIDMRMSFYLDKMCDDMAVHAAVILASW
jgi:hypothetical protein